MLVVYDEEILEGRKDPDVETVGREDLEDRDEIVEALDFLQFLLYLLLANVYLNWGGFLWMMFLCTY